MESFDLAPVYAQNLSLLQSPVLCNASPDQVELFYSLPPHLQQIVFTGAWSDEREQRCEPNYEACYQVFNLWTIFLCQDTFSEYAHFRAHGMCTKCKEEHDRRAAGRQESPDGLDHSQPRANSDERAMEVEGYLQDTASNEPTYEEILREARESMEYEMFIRGG